MTKTLWFAALSSLLLAGAACEKGETDLTEQRIDMPRPEVHTQRADNVEPAPAPAAETDTDVTDDLARMKRDFRTEGAERLQRLDARIAALEARADAESKETAVRLRARRDELAARLDRAEDEADTSWDNFKKDVGDAFSELEKDIDESF